MGAKSHNAALNHGRLFRLGRMASILLARLIRSSPCPPCIRMHLFSTMDSVSSYEEARVAADASDTKHTSNSALSHGAIPSRSYLSARTLRLHDPRSFWEDTNVL